MSRSVPQCLQRDLVDFGAGVMRRAQGACEKGVLALNPHEIHIAFLTHLHQNHTTGYADLIFSPLGREWRVVGRCRRAVAALDTSGPQACHRRRPTSVSECEFAGWRCVIAEVEE